MLYEGLMLNFYVEDCIACIHRLFSTVSVVVTLC